jgi:hypothetical protein
LASAEDFHPGKALGRGERIAIGIAVVHIRLATRKGEYQTALQVVKKINMPEDP